MTIKETPEDQNQPVKTTKANKQEKNHTHKNALYNLDI